MKALISECEQQREYLKSEDGVDWYCLERAIAKKAWVKCNFKEAAIWPFEESQRGCKPKVITFYSFKGGMGRTTALAAVALALASDGKNVLTIDTDIEAPGLASLFFDRDHARKGVVDYLLGCSCGQENIDLSDMILQVDGVLMDEIKGNIFVIPAGVVDLHYLEKLARIDCQDAIPNNLKNQLCRLLQNAVDAIENNGIKVDYVLLDSRAGFHDLGGVVTAQIPQGVILFGKDSTQSWQGMNLVLRAIGTSQEKAPPFVAIVDSLCGTSGVVSAEEKESFLRESYVSFGDFFTQKRNRSQV